MIREMVVKINTTQQTTFSVHKIKNMCTANFALKFFFLQDIASINIQILSPLLSAEYYLYKIRALKR